MIRKGAVEAMTKHVEKIGGFSLYRLIMLSNPLQKVGGLLFL